MKYTISPKLRQIETGMRLRQIWSFNLRHSTVSGTSIALTITSPTLSPDLQWTAIPSLVSSDLYPIVITMTPANRPLNYQEERYNFRKGN